MFRGFFLLCGFSCLHALGVLSTCIQSTTNEPRAITEVILSSPQVTSLLCHMLFPLPTQAKSSSCQCRYQSVAIMSPLFAPTSYPPPSPLPKLDTLPPVIAVPPSSRVSLCVPQKLGLKFLFSVEENHTQWECTHLPHTRPADPDFSY